VLLGGSATAFMLFVINAVLRGAGDAAVAMRVLWFANATNIVLGPMLIFGVGPFPELGVTGAAIATTIGRGAGVVYALSRLVKGSGNISIRRRHLALEFATMRSLLRMSVSSTVSGAGWFDELDSAGGPDRKIRQRRTGGLHHCDAEVAHVAVRGLRIMAVGFPLYALGMSLEQAFNGAGDVNTPTWINIVVFWLFEIPLAWVLAKHTSWEWQSIFISVLAAYSFLAVLAYVVFKRGRWRTVKV